MNGGLTVAQVLERAAQYIEQRGWCRGRLVNTDGQVCLNGARNAALTGDPAKFSTAPIHAAVNQAMRQFAFTLPAVNVIVDGPADWNDNVCRSKDEAVAFLRAAARCAS